MTFGRSYIYQYLSMPLKAGAKESGKFLLIYIEISDMTLSKAFVYSIRDQGKNIIFEYNFYFSMIILGKRLLI